MTTQAVLFRSGTPADSKAGDPLAYISPSRLKSFLTCRLKFFYEKVLGLKSPSSPNLQIGKAVHAGLQHFNIARWRGDDTSPEQMLEDYHTAYSALEDEDPVEYRDKDRQVCIDKGERVLNAYLESDLVHDPRRVIGVEVYLRREAGELPLPLVGIVDLVLEGNVPVDYKTIATTPNLHEEAWQHDLQLTAYHLLMEDATGETPGPAELVYLAKLKTPKIIKHELPAVTPLQIDRFKSLADAFIEGVTREEYYPSPGMHCRWCSFRSECAAWSGNAVAA